MKRSMQWAAAVLVAVLCDASGLGRSEAQGLGPESFASPMLPMKVPIPGADPRTGIPPGKVTVLALDELPPAARWAAEHDLKDYSEGFKSVPDSDIQDDLANFMNIMAAPSNGPRLENSTLRLGATELSQWPHLGTIPGLRVQGQIVMETRVFKRPDNTMVFVEEFAYPRSPGSGIVVVRELQNVMVGPYPARLSVDRSPGGLARSTLTWATDRGKFDITVFDDVDAPRDPRWGRAWILSTAANLGT